MEGVAALDVTGALVSSAVIAAIVAALSSLLTQRYLLVRKAQVDYEYMARKRLNEAIGPLRMQLLVSARDVVGRVEGHIGTGWNMDPKDHYVRSFVYRLLRPPAVAQLIEQQMSVADFSVDPGAIALLRFNRAVERLIAGDDEMFDHPAADWSTQSQHLFRDNLRAAAARLIVEDDERQVVMDYSRFRSDVPALTSDPALRDLAQIFGRCQSNLAQNPLFWLRVVGYAYASARLIGDYGVPVGFERLSPDFEAMLRAADDELISSQPDAYIAGFERILGRGL